MSDESPNGPSKADRQQFGVTRLIKQAVKKMILYTVLIVAGTYLALTLMMYIFQERMVFVPGRNVFATPASYKIDFEDINLKTDNDETISAWYIPAKDAKYTVLFCHGNAGNIANRLETAVFYHNHGYNFMVFDYPGYGKSTGKPSDKGLLRAAEAAWKYLVETREIDPESIIVAGRSLGGSAASHLASKYDPAMLCLEATFVSVKEAAKDVVPFLPVSLICRVHLPTGENLRKVKCPVLLIHSPHDEVINYRHGEKLYEIAPEPKEFHTLKGGHNDCWFIDQNRYAEIFKAFIAKHVDKNQADG